MALFIRQDLQDEQDVYGFALQEQDQHQTILHNPVNPV
jgi:hypothetical protein